MVLFDGDYASLTCHLEAPSRDAGFVGAILEAVVANPHVMRDLPRRLPEAGLVLDDMTGDVLLEAEAEDWSAQVQRDSAEDRFFGSCNFVTCLALHP